MDAEDIKMCDCAGCGQQLIGESMRKVIRTRGGVNIDGRVVPWVKGRILGRPYCHACLNVKQIPGPTGPREDSPGPYYENAIKQMEDRQ